MQVPLTQKVNDTVVGVYFVHSRPKHNLDDVTTFSEWRAKDSLTESGIGHRKKERTYDKVARKTTSMKLLETEGYKRKVTDLCGVGEGR